MMSPCRHQNVVQCADQQQHAQTPEQQVTAAALQEGEGPGSKQHGKHTDEFAVEEQVDDHLRGPVNAALRPLGVPGKILGVDADDAQQRQAAQHVRQGGALGG